MNQKNHEMKARLTKLYELKQKTLFFYKFQSLEQEQDTHAQNDKIIHFVYI